MSIKPSKMSRRIQIVLGLVLLCFVILEGRLIWIQLYKGEEYESMAYENRFHTVTLEAKRGTIYDTNGKVLAISVNTDSFYANPREVVKAKDIGFIVDTLSSALDLNPVDLRAKITDTSKAFVYIKRQVDTEISQPIKELKLTGIHTLEEPRRVYPKGSLLSNLLGYVGTDGNGLGGVEASFDDTLAGKDGTLMVEQDRSGNAITDAAEKYIAPVQGQSLQLTIDETIQYICEEELQNMVDVRDPDYAGVLVMRPKTGEVLAYAEYPTYDPNSFSEYPAENRKSWMISNVYEPGSTFKTLVLGAALEEGEALPTDEFYCSGAYVLDAGTIHCWKIGSHGNQTLMEAVQNSCNPAFITIGLGLGKELMYKYVQGFGIGSKTGLGLNGESAGMLQSQQTISEFDVASMSIGQSLAVTPVQLLTGFCAICNGGYLMKPQIISGVLDSEGEMIQKYEPEVVRQVISNSTSETELKMLESVVSVGTGKAAYVKGYRVGGKTGTAQRAKLDGSGYDENAYVASFMGCAPIDDPEIAMLVVCNNPKTEVHSGSACAAPVFSACAQKILTYLKVPAEVDPSDFTGGYKNNIVIPDFSNSSLESAKQRAVNSGLEVTVIGEGDKVYAQLPLANTKVVSGGSVILYTNIPTAMDSIQQIPVPELAGKTVVEISDIAINYNLNFEYSGEGVCIYQDPSPGTMLNTGSTVKVTLEPAVTDKSIIEMAAP